MSIAAIGELTMPGMMPGMVQPQREEQQGDFMQAFNNAKDSVVPDAAALKTEGSAASGKDSGFHEPAAKDMQRSDRNVADKAQKAEKPAEAKSAEKTEKPAAAEKAEAPGDAASGTNDAQAEEPVDEETLATVSAAAQQLIDALAQLVDMSPEEFSDALAELDVSGIELLAPGAGNELVAELMADGDISALLTDQNLSDLAAQFSETIGEAVSELTEELSQDAEQLFGPALDAVVKDEGKAPEATQSVEDILSDAIIPADEQVQDIAQPQDAQAQNKSDTQPEYAGSGQQSGVRRESRERVDVREDAPAFEQQQFMDTQRVDATEPVPEAAQLRYTTDPEEILNQVADHIKSDMSEDMSSLEMVLHPASLGNVAVRLVSQDGAVTAQFTAQNDSVREALQSQLAVLKENMEQAGVKVEAVEVTVASHAFEQNLEQGNDGQSEAEAGEQERLRRATHRIDLGDYAEGEDIVVDEADAVTVQMMQADGNRMDYRA